jgi:uridylate kinase
MNALALADALKRVGIDPRVQTAIEMRAVAEPYIRGRAIRHLEKGRVIILGAGTGNPYFTTDTAAALRAMEIDADLLVKATKVDGVYETDPKADPNARRFETINYIDALNMGLKVLDGTALTLCMENEMPIVVLNLWQPGSLKNMVMGDTSAGTLICS